MGCVLPKPSPHSPPRGLVLMKLDAAYVSSAELRLRPQSRVAAAVTPGGEEGDGGAGEVYDQWPQWLTDNVPWEVLEGIVPKRADDYVKIGKIGQGTYSNVYKARDRDTGKIVALKKVRFDTSESESVKFMAREITILQKLDHPNVIKLEGLATSRMQYSLYLVFDFMQTDLSKVLSLPDARLTEPQVKCYMQQLLSGLQHCHERGILHRDIKGSNLLIDENGMLKIADFGLANSFNPKKKRPLTSRVVTLWYRAPELLLGTRNYGAGIDLWSAGCLLAEMFVGRAIMPGSNEVEQLHRVFKLCGSPSEDYWRKLKLSTSFQLPQPYKPSILEKFRDLPSSSLSLLTTLLAIEPSYRGSAASALQNEFFSTSPLACDLSGLPVIYTQNEEPNQHLQRRRRQRLRQLASMPTVQTEIEVTAKEDSGSLKEKALEPVNGNQALSTSPGRNVTGMDPERYPTSPLPSSMTSVASPLPEPPRRSRPQSSATRNPPIVPAYKESRHRKEGLKHVHRRHSIENRSTSTSAFRRFGDQTQSIMVLAD